MVLWMCNRMNRNKVDYDKVQGSQADDCCKVRVKMQRKEGMKRP